MDVRGGGERNGSVGSKEEATFSKRCTSFTEYEDDEADRRATSLHGQKQRSSEQR